MTKKVVLFVVLAVALLLSACGPAALTGAEVVYDVPSTVLPTREPTVEVTPTLEPTPTQVVEYPSPDQEWFLENIFSVAEDAGYQPYYETSYYPEVAHIPWTVDAEGNTVQGITYLYMCSIGPEDTVNSQTEPPYLALFKVGDGYPQREIDRSIEWHGVVPWMGLTYQVSLVSFELPSEHQGFLGENQTLDLKVAWQEVRVGNGWDFPDLYPTVVIAICDSLAALYRDPAYSYTVVSMSDIVE